MKIKPFFLWRDGWVGYFFDDSKRIVYICPIPMCGIEIHLPSKRNSPEKIDTSDDTKTGEDSPGRTFEKKTKLLLGLASIYLYIEDRYPDEKDGFEGKYKVFLMFRALWIREVFTFRVAHLGYFF